MNNNLLINLY